MCRALDDLSTHGKTYELCGPRQYTLKELVELVCEMTGRHRAVIGLSDRLSYWQAFVMERLPGKLITRDNLRSMQVPNVCARRFPLRHPAGGARSRGAGLPRPGGSARALPAASLARAALSR
jgi:hypothetical protein